MKSPFVRIAWLLTILCAAPWLAANGWSTTWYVATNGSDSNSGSSSAPFRSIQKAANVVNAGDTVIVRDGTYSNSSLSGTGSKLVVMSRGGTSGNWVTFQAEHKWGAVVDGLNNTTQDGWVFGAHYIRVKDFEVKGFSEAGFQNYSGGQYLDIVGNNVHDIGRRCNDSTQGAEGFFISSPNVTIEQNVIHDIGRYAPGENGCNPSTGYYQNHDHGIYVAGETGADNVTIRNNMIYNCARGWGIQIYPATLDNLQIVNNTFAFPNPWRVGHIILAAPLTNSRIDNNIFYQPTTAGVDIDTTSGYSGVSITNNITYQGSIANGSPSGISFANNRDNTDPQVVSASSRDFRLTSASPAINAGMTRSDVQDDYYGTPRPQGASYDIGAHEYLSGSGGGSGAAVSDLTLTLSGPGSLASGQIGASYTTTVKNTGGASSSGIIALVQVLSPGLVPTALNGSGWTCVLGTLVCTRGDALAAGASYPVITLTVDVVSNAFGAITNTATVSGGGETATSNDSASSTALVSAITPPPPPPGGSGCTAQALQVARQQVSKTISYLSTSQYPQATIPPSNHWDAFSASDDWTPGFFPGLLWYTYEQTLDSSLLSRAQAQTTSLSGLATSPSDATDLGFKMMASYGNGYRITRNPAYLSVIQTAAQTKAALYSSGAGVFNSVPGYNRSTVNVIIDDMVNLDLMFFAAQHGGDPNWYNMAVSHALKTMQNNVRADGSTYQGVEYNSNGTVAGYFRADGSSTSSTWARGQAWGILGFTIAYRYTRDSRFLATAQKLADYFISHLPPDYVPVWDFSRPSADPRDSSASAIAASALVELSGYVTDSSKQSYYHNAAFNIQAYLSDSGYYLGDPNTTDGIVIHGTYSVPSNVDVDTSVIWGDYYFMESCNRATPIPSQVVGLTVTSAGSSQVALTWQAQSGAIRYNVKRGTQPGGPYTILAPSSVLTANSYTDSSVAANTTYYYVVSASSPGGEGPNSTERTASSLTSPGPSSAPDLTLSISHFGDFARGQSGALYTMAVNNVGSGAASGTVVVSDALPSGLIATAFSGSGWTCVVSSATCTRGDQLPAGGTYPVLSLVVDVDSHSSPWLTNTASVSGGGDTNSSNNTATDSTRVRPH